MLRLATLDSEGSFSLTQRGQSTEHPPLPSELRNKRNKRNTSGQDSDDELERDIARLVAIRRARQNWSKA